jgi:glutamate formiminotransferase
VDVVPFVPVRSVETSEAVDAARRFGKFVGGLGVPVYYYEAAATRPERERLPHIRKGQYEGLAEKLKDPAWMPNDGPATFNARSGALVTGARFPLIAFNVNLRTANLSIAERVARAVRHIDGGYRHVRAMVQVSMNPVKYAKTPIPRVWETIRCECARYGVSIAETELVGPVPLGAVEDVFKYYLQAHDFTSEQIIETALID